MTLIDAEVFLQYLIFSKHIDSLKCKEVKEAVEMSKVDVFGKILAEIEALPKTYPFMNHIDAYVKEDDVRKIIDKYRESENGK